MIDSKKLIENSTSIVAISGSAILVLSVVYDFSYYFGLGLNISSIPISIQDIITGAITWLPTWMIGFNILSILIIPVVFYMKEWVLRILLWNLFLASSTIIVIGYFMRIPGWEIGSEEAIARFVTAICILILIPIDWMIYRKKLISKTQYIITIYIVFFILFTALSGFNRGKLEVYLPDRFDEIRLKSRGNENPVIGVKILRNFQSGVLVINNTNRFNFYSREDILSIDTSRFVVQIGAESAPSSVPSPAPIPQFAPYIGPP